MNPIWLIESDVYGVETANLVDEIRRQNMLAVILPHRALTKGFLPTLSNRSLHADDCVLGFGTYPFARHIQLHYKWKPGAWCEAGNLDCCRYFAHFGCFLLNGEYAIMPGVEAIRQAAWLFSVFGKEDRVFARPTGCHKLFTGWCVEKKSFAEQLAPARYDPATLVVISSPKPIAREWRLVIDGSDIIAASQYANQGRKEIVPGCPQEVSCFVHKMLREVSWRPDPLFMMDVGESDGDLHLIELNSFSSSGLYGCDVAAVVARASELAQREWQRDKL